MSRTSSSLRPLILALFGIYLFVYPWSVLLTALDMVPLWGAWMGGALLIVQGMVMGLWLTAHYGRHGAVASLLILIISGAIEHIGVQTGFPFGSYIYTDALTPKVFGVVPLAIPFAWLLVVPAAMGVTDWLLRNDDVVQRNRAVGVIMRLIGTASFALLLDLTIEPVAVHVKRYWIWDGDGSGYYGIPASNFVAWWFTSFILVSVLQLCISIRNATQRKHSEVAPSTRPQMLLPWLPRSLYLLNLTMFVLVNLGHGQHGATAVGMLILAYLAFSWLEPNLLHWVLGTRPDNRQPEM